MKFLILSPHTDDAELGCGGTIARVIEEGNEILWVVFSTAEDSLPRDMPKDTLKKEFLDVIRDLGLSENNYELCNFKVRHLKEHRQDVLDTLVKIRRDFEPKTVIMPSLNDYHQDHQVIARETVRAFKKDASIIGYELPWNHVSFDTNMFIILDKRHIQRKYKIIKNYKSQIILNRNYFSKEYIYGLARVRGVQCNATYAEAFEVVRYIL
jgi:LmbE family N-acetylglucosaminyl deacetylase